MIRGTLSVHIRWLRLKVEDDASNPRYIHTVRGFGYRFVSPEELANDGTLTGDLSME